MKWIALLLTLGVARGIVFPDYRFVPNLIIIPFFTPAGFAALSAYLAVVGKLNKSLAFACGLLAIYLSEIIGTVVYGYSVGWQYVTEDLETHAVIQATVLAQTIVYIITLPLAYRVLRSRYNNTSNATL